MTPNDILSLFNYIQNGSEDIELNSKSLKKFEVVVISAEGEGKL